MMVDESMYSRGQQPCQKPDFENDGNSEWFGLAEHECIFCSDMDRGGRVLFCSNCHRDHHYNGYETCERKKVQPHRRSHEN